jgi:DNA processing protein
MANAEPQLRLSLRQRKQWVRLIRSERVGPVTFKSLINRFGSAEAALEALPRLVADSGALASAKIPSVGEIEAEFEAAAKLGAQFVALGEPEYPILLRHVENAPPILAVAGDVSTLAHKAVAIVGSRSASANGMTFSRRIAFELAEAGLAIASGLARGIDRAAHEGALAARTKQSNEYGSGAVPSTIAVLAGGLDRPYPPQNLDLFDQMREKPGACVISVMPFGHEPQARDFPRRNGIIAGLSLGVVIVEAAEKSGSLITARMATELGREVFAVPGHPNDPRSVGTNGLIREGAILIRGAEDVFEALKPMMAETGAPKRIASEPRTLKPEASFVLHKTLAQETNDTRQPPSRHQPIERVGVTSVEDKAPALLKPNTAAKQSNLEPSDLILACLSTAPTALDDLVRETGLPAARVLAALTELELDGRIIRGSGGVVSLVL